MRTEVKVGIFVAVMAIGVGSFFFLQNTSDSGENVVTQMPLRNESAAKPASDAPPKRPQAARGPLRRRPESPSPTARRRDSGRRQPGQAPRESTQTPPRLAGHREITTPTTRPSTPAVLKPDPGSTERLKQRPTRAAKPESGPAQPATRPAPKPAVAQPKPGVTPPVQPRVKQKPTGALPRPPNRPSPTRLGTRRHTVVDGDNLWNLAEKYYGNGALFVLIKNANPDIVPNRLPVGQVIVIPPAEDQPASEPMRKERESTPVIKPGVRVHTYIVERGDTLTSIAINILGDSKRWKEIHELNKDKIPDPNVLKPGTELRLPPK